MSPFLPPQTTCASSWTIYKWKNGVCTHFSYLTHPTKFILEPSNGLQPPLGRKFCWNVYHQCIWLASYEGEKRQVLRPLPLICWLLNTLLGPTAGPLSIHPSGSAAGYSRTVFYYSLQPGFSIILHNAFIISQFKEIQWVLLYCLLNQAKIPSADMWSPPSKVLLSWPGRYTFLLLSNNLHCHQSP